MGFLDADRVIGVMVNYHWEMAPPAFASSIRALTFDCYGTLIDWETGILRALESMLGAGRVQAERHKLIASYARHERTVETGPYRTYRVVLEEVAGRLCMEFGVPIHPAMRTRFADAIADWPAFLDTATSLQKLKERYKLAIVSNVDDDLFALTVPKLGVEFDAVVTAQQVRAYKPKRAHFDEVLKRLALRPDEVLHVAESKFHDIEPATALGFHTCWVNRHAADRAPSASGEGSADPDLTLSSLAELVKALGI